MMDEKELRNSECQDYGNKMKREERGWFVPHASIQADDGDW